MPGIFAIVLHSCGSLIARKMQGSEGISPGRGSDSVIVTLAWVEPASDNSLNSSPLSRGHCCRWARCGAFVSICSPSSATLRRGVVVGAIICTGSSVMARGYSVAKDLGNVHSSMRVDRGPIDCARYIRNQPPVMCAVGIRNWTVSYPGALSDGLPSAARVDAWTRQSKVFRESLPERDWENCLADDKHSVQCAVRETGLGSSSSDDLMSGQLSFAISRHSSPTVSSTHAALFRLRLIFYAVAAACVY
jgi:hypothetical protein